MNTLIKTLLSAIIVVSLFTFSKQRSPEKIKILIFTKTKGFRHKSIPQGKAAILKIANEQGFLADTTENSSFFTEDSLKNYAAVIFLNTTGDVLNNSQQASFERYIRAGGGYAGIHAAADTEYEWPWYGKLTGAYFASHPKIQEAVLEITDKKHPATKHLPQKWKRTDEWYNYKEISSDIKTLIKIDEKSYNGGKNGDNHPISWYHEYDGGRAFYTGLGHTADSYKDPLFLKHVLGGIKYAIGNTRP